MFWLNKKKKKKKKFRFCIFLFCLLKETKVSFSQNEPNALDKINSSLEMIANEIL